jgi:hypothetical protein
VAGATGVAGNTGIQGVTGFAFAEYQNSQMINANKMIDWSNGLKQHLSVTGLGATGYQIGFVNGQTGMNGTLRIDYVNASPPGITGCSWPNGVRPTLSLSTASTDMISVYYNGSTYFAQAALAFAVA